MDYAFPLPGTYTETDYYNLPEHTHAELIEGQFYNMSAPSRIHQEILSFLHVEIANYIRAGKGPCRVYPAPFAVKLFQDNKTIVAPDISVICNPDKLTDKGCSGAPDWIIEIVSPGNPEHDYIEKLSLYKRAGVREYWIADPLSGKITVYCLEESRFQTDTHTFADTIRAGIFDDLQIDFQSLEI